MDQIKGTIYLGDINDATNPDWKGDIICVLQDIEPDVPKRALWIPIIRTSGNLNKNDLISDQDVDVVALRQQLDLVARELEERFVKSTPTLIHCLGGMERSPLAVMYWLHKYHNFTWNDAFDFVHDKRRVVMNRYEWLNMTYEESQS